jgi:hypothetical protein
LSATLEGRLQHHGSPASYFSLASPKQGPLRKNKAVILSGSIILLIYSATKAVHPWQFRTLLELCGSRLLVVSSSTDELR